MNILKRNKECCFQPDWLLGLWHHSGLVTTKLNFSWSFSLFENSKIISDHHSKVLQAISTKHSTQDMTVSIELMVEKFQVEVQPSILDEALLKCSIKTTQSSERKFPNEHPSSFHYLAWAANVNTPSNSLPTNKKTTSRPSTNTIFVFSFVLHL